MECKRQAFYKSGTILGVWLFSAKIGNFILRPMGHIAHMRKQFESINTYDYIITLNKRRQKNPLTLREYVGSSFEETWIPFTQGCFVSRLFEIANWLSGSGEEDFLISSMDFCYFVIISPSKRAGLFIWRNLNPLHSRMHCVKFGWNWPSGSGEEDFKIPSMYFQLFNNYLPLEKGRALHLNKLESPSPKDALCQV